MSPSLAEAPKSGAIISRGPITLRDFPECKFSETKLEIPDNMTFDRWQELGRYLSRASKGVQFWIGDWIIHGEARHGEMYSQALEATDFDYQTLANAVFVARNVKFSVRTEKLSFNHHLVVAPLPTPTQQALWLSRAVKENWAYRELKRRIAGAKALNRLGKNRMLDKNVIAHLNRTLEKIKEIIDDCCEPDLVSRHYSEWEDDIRFELSERGVIDLQEKLLLNWKEGRKTDEALTQATGLTKAEITQILGVRLGWSKHREGKRTEGQKGDRAWVWAPPGEPTGEVNMAHAQSRYSNPEIIDVTEED